MKLITRYESSRVVIHCNTLTELWSYVGHYLFAPAPTRELDAVDLNCAGLQLGGFLYASQVLFR